MENQSIAKNLVYHRKTRGYSQAELSEMTNVTVRTIQRIENEQVNPHLKTIKLLATALDVDVDDLLVLDDPKEETIQKKWLLLLHGTPLLGLTIPLCNVLIPLFLWIHKREDNSLYDRHGRAIINFHLTMTILFALAFVALLTIEGYGFFFFIAVVPYTIIVTLINVITALNSQRCYYPLAFPFLRSKKSTVSKAIAFFCLSGLFSLASCSPVASQYISQSAAADLQFKALSAGLDSLRKAHHIPGLAVDVVHDQKLARSKGYGSSHFDIDDGAVFRSFTPTTPFWIASATKTFVGLLFLQLEEQGKIDINNHINDMPGWDSQETSTFYCPPCNCQAHETDKDFKDSGTCPYCGMSLIQVQNTADSSISYQRLLEYEGKYEYISESTLQIMASPMDTMLYAVIDHAKYPLFYEKEDTFTNIVDKPIVFQRNEQGNVKGYIFNGQSFDLITTDIEKLAMYPRKELFDHPEDYTYQTPEKTNDGLAVGNIKNVFEKPELIKEMVKETIKGKYPDVHSILIYKDNKLVLEEYFYGYDTNTQHQLRSATKVFFGSLVGLAIKAGAIGSEQDRLLPYFKDEYKSFDHMSKRKRNITIQDFLTYRHGLDCENNNPESAGNELRMMKSDDWVKYTLDLPVVHQPGKISSYCTGVALTLGRLVELATNKSLEKFADETLFKPLGITDYDWRFDPDSSSRQTFSQMYLQPRDLVKLAKMYMNGGKWQGKQILPENWVRKTFKEYTPEFGYLWEHNYFIIDGKRYNSYMASGNGGQKIYIWPDYNMITVFTGGNYNSYALYGKSTPPNYMIPKYILPALD